MNNLNHKNFKGALRGLRTALCGICLSLVCCFSARAGIIVCDPQYPVIVFATGTPVSESGGGSAQFNFSLAQPVEDITHLTIQITGTAANGVDYQTLTNQVTIPAGQTSAILNVVPKPDAIAEGTEDVTVTIIDSDNPCVGVGYPNSATVYIVDANPTMAASLDTTNMVWATGGNVAWSPLSTISHDGVDAALSGIIFDNQESWLETSVNGPGTVSFWWKVSSEQDFDWLRFHIDGVLQTQISGEIDWQQRSYPLAQGAHTLRWRYVKDSNGSVGQDRAWLDQVIFTPGAGAPVFVAQPANQVAWNGANVILSAVAMGAAPLSQHWVFNDTNNIPRATNATLTLNNISPAQAGTYRLVVANTLGAATSAVCTVTLNNNGPVSQILLFSDSLVASPFEAALSRLGRTFQKFTVETTFNSAVNGANRASTLVIIDAPQATYSFSTLTGFINGGGRALIQAYTLASSPSLTTTFQAAIESRSTAPLPLYNWGGSPLFVDLSPPIAFKEINLNEDAQKLHPLPGGRSVAGFGSSPKPGEAAVVIGSGGRTIVNGFYAEGATLTANAVQLAQNEIAFLAGIVGLPAPGISGVVRNASGQLGFNVNGTPGQRFLIESSTNMVTWTQLQTNTLGTSAFTFTDSQPASLPKKFFRLRANP